MTDSTSLTQSRPKVHPFNNDLSVFTHQEREEEQRQDGLPQLNPFGTDAHQDNQEPQVSEHAEKSGYSEHLDHSNGPDLLVWNRGDADGSNDQEVERCGSNDGSRPQVSGMETKKSVS